MGDTKKSTTITITKNGAPLNLTDYLILLNYFSITKTIVKAFTTEDNSIQIIDAENGVFRINDWRAILPAAEYISDIKFLSPDGIVNAYIQVTQLVKKGYTQLP